MNCSYIWNRVRRASAGFAAAVLCIAGLPAGATAGGASVQHFNLDTFVVDTCSSDSLVHITGFGKIVVQTTVNPDGTLHLRETDQIHGHGSTADGRNYVLNETAHIDQTIGPNPDGTPFTYSERRTQRLISTGGAPDQKISYTIMLVIDGDGNVTVDIFDAKVECL